jgi:hypothetical protein
MGNGLISHLLTFIREEHIKMQLKTISDSEFWLESPMTSVVAKFYIDHDAHEIVYDVFLPKYDVHLKEETLKDVENLEFIAEEHEMWKLVEDVEDIWLILDAVKVWAQKNAYKKVREIELL